MSDKTGIEWTDATWNPVTGCAKVSQGCKHCYAEREWPRMTKLVPAYAGRDFSDVRTHADRLEQPLRWKKPRKVFVNSMSDLFHPDVPDEFFPDVFAVMAAAKQHVFQVLTKRPERMREVLNDDAFFDAVACMALQVHGVEISVDDWPLRNVWLGVSVEDQAAADERIPLLLDTPAAVRWISAEPLLGPVDLTQLTIIEKSGNRPGAWLNSLNGHIAGPDDMLDTRLDWVVVGGESGPKARPMHPQWARDLRDQCAAACVPFLFKQWSEWHTGYATSDGTPVFRQFESYQHWVNKASTWVRGGICLDSDGRELKIGTDFMRARDEGKFPVTIMHRVGVRKAGRLLDGVTHDGYPEGEKA